MKHFPVVISCDWFAYSCTCEGGRTPILGESVEDPVTGAIFTFCEGTERHPFYESSCIAREGRAPIAHLFYTCKRTDNRYSTQVKVDNSRLYYARWGESLQALIRALHWRVRICNRIDICADFNFFANGRSPLQFCQDYLSKPTASRPSFIRHSSNKVHAFATRTLHSIRYDTLSWGTRDSAVQVNLYNKSLELVEHADKPWIRQRWIENGLEHDPEGSPRKFVWRVEFSINPQALYIREKGSKEPLGLLNLNHVFTPAALIETWQILHPRYFTFHVLSKEDAGNPKIRVRDLPIVTLFERSDLVKYEVRGLQYFRKSNRTDKLLLKRLEAQLADSDLTADEKVSVRHVVSLLQWKIGQASEAASRANLANDALDDYMADCFRHVLPADNHSPIAHTEALRRRARLWSRMLIGVHDPDVERYLDAFHQLEEIEGTEAFETCLRYANYVAGGAMPDEVISDFVDEDIFREDIACQSPIPQNHPVEDGIY